MGLFDRFTSKKGSSGTEKKPKHVVDAKEKSDAAKKEQFAAVPSSGAEKKADAKPKAAVAPVIRKSKGDSGDAYRILLRGIVSEKASLIAGHNQYAFMVAPEANKISIATAVAKLYGVKPIAVNVVNLHGKNIRYGRFEGRTKGVKKAIVTLKKGESINVSA